MKILICLMLINEVKNVKSFVWFGSCRKKKYMMFNIELDFLNYFLMMLFRLLSIA
jgi:hypothetical protein